MPLLGDTLEALADKLKPVSVEAEKLLQAIFEKLSPNAVKTVLPVILKEYDGKWQSNLGRANLLSTIASRFPKQANRELVTIIPVLSGLMWDTKPQVKEAAAKAMDEVCATVTNKDIVASVPDLIGCILKPEQVNETVHKLAGIVFVSEIHSCDLAIFTPLLKRGMDESSTATKRNVARIVENMGQQSCDLLRVRKHASEDCARGRRSR